jgi:hypothetical protein
VYHDVPLLTTASQARRAPRLAPYVGPHRRLPDRVVGLAEVDAFAVCLSSSFICGLPAIVRRLPDDGWSICGWSVFL